MSVLRLVRIEARGNRESMEDKKESEEVAKIEATPNTENIGLSKLRTWNLNIKKRFQITNGECLILP